MTWIDQDLSQQLLTLCQSGESQKLDYKREVPAQARDLAKDIAAFASSGGGLILLGVRDDGSVAGVPNADQPGERDALSQRIAGICKAIEPPVRPKLRWVVVNDQVVLAIDVPAGSEPMYYVEHKPYLRHETTCRPAKPSEVYDAIKAHTRETADSEGGTNAILTRLAGVLVKLLRWAHIDSDARNLKPWATNGNGMRGMRPMLCATWRSRSRSAVRSWKANFARSQKRSTKWRTSHTPWAVGPTSAKSPSVSDGWRRK